MNANNNGANEASEYNAMMDTENFSKNSLLVSHTVKEINGWR